MKSSYFIIFSLLLLGSCRKPQEITEAKVSYFVATKESVALTLKERSALGPVRVIMKDGGYLAAAETDTVRFSFFDIESIEPWQETRTWPYIVLGLVLAVGTTFMLLINAFSKSDS
jgi:hypothetical protein